MANRAYLYRVEQIDESTWDNVDRDYYDSRWTVPLAGFFFFDASCLHRLERDGWWELKLVSDWSLAQTRYESRLERLLSIVRPADVKLLMPFVRRLASGRGNFLVMDPHEVVEDDGNRLD